MKPTRRSFVKWLAAIPAIAPLVAKAKPKYEHKTYGTGFTIDTEGMTHSEALAAIDSRITGAESNFNRDTDSYVYPTDTAKRLQPRLRNAFDEEYSKDAADWDEMFRNHRETRR